MQANSQFGELANNRIRNLVGGWRLAPGGGRCPVKARSTADDVVDAACEERAGCGGVGRNGAASALGRVGGDQGACMGKLRMEVFLGS